MPEAARDAKRSRDGLLEVARVFLKLGVIGFGGPAAHIALMEQETVARRRWLGRQEFVDLVGAVNLIPGPNSTELAIHLGLRRAGPRGLLVAGACFIAPAALLTLACAWAYVRFGTLPAAESALYGIKPAILAIVLAAMVRLAQAGLGRPALLALGTAAAAASLLGMGELKVLLMGGLAALAASWLSQPGGIAPALALAALPAQAAAQGVAVPAMAAPSLGAIGLFFLKLGSVLYGSGYVLVAFLHGGLVPERHWLTEQQLLDAVAVGQFTPGPVFTTATFVGYLLGGVAGAAVATLGIFLPSFVFVAATSRWIPLLRTSRGFSAFLDGVNAAALGLMLAVVLQLARGALTDAPAWLIGAAALAVTTLTRVNATWVILAAAVLGLVSRWVR